MLTINISMLTTTEIARRCGWTRVWAWAKARDGIFDEFKLPGWTGKHYRFRDCEKLRKMCAAFKADRERARRAKPSASGMTGVSTWQGLAIQFDLMRRQVGDDWKEWPAETLDAVLGKLRPQLEFAQLLRRRIRRQKAE